LPRWVAGRKPTDSIVTVNVPAAQLALAALIGHGRHGAPPATGVAVTMAPAIGARVESTTRVGAGLGAEGARKERRGDQDSEHQSGDGTTGHQRLQIEIETESYFQD
jgi:hypothetical protein